MKAPSTTFSARSLADALQKIHADSRPSNWNNSELIIDSVSVSLRNTPTYDPRTLWEYTSPLVSSAPELHLAGQEAFVLYMFARFVADKAQKEHVNDTILLRMVDDDPMFSYGIYALIPSQQGYNVPAEEVA